MRPRKMPGLSKSKFMAGQQCVKRLYLLCYGYEPPGEPDEGKEAILAQGQEVGILARQAFPGGVLIDDDHVHHREAEVKTHKLMKDGKVPAIFEAAFTFENVRVRVDILRRSPGGRWRIIEVKSTSEAKEEHVPDLAIQAYVLKSCGIKVSSTCLMHLDRGYVFDGKVLDVKKLFAIEDLTKKTVAFMKRIPAQLAANWRILSLDNPPEVEPGDQCTNPYECDYYQMCNEEKPSDWIGHLPRISDSRLKHFLAEGIESIHDLTDPSCLSEIQSRAWRCVRQGKAHFGPGLRKELASLRHPICFMDFETFYPAIPRYRGMRPFDHIPFQWSVHVQRDPASKIEHHEFLADDARDPREEFIQKLLMILEGRVDPGFPGKGPIVVYNKSFESSRLDDLAMWFPQYARRIEIVKKRIWDLLPVIRKHVYHPKFYGSFSIKSVLPALIPHMTYDGMEVSDGGEAGLAYAALVQGDLDEPEMLRLKKALGKYCGQDTLAMVKLTRRLQGELSRTK